MVQYEFDHINGIIFRDKLADGKSYSRKEVKRTINEENKNLREG